MIIILLTTIDGVNNIFYYGKKQYNKKEILESQAIMGWQKEYLPETSTNYKIETSDKTHLMKRNDIQMLDYPYKIIANNNISIKVLKDTNKYYKFKIKNLKKDTNIIIPRTYYLGYQLTHSNKKYQLKESKNGKLETKIDKNGIYTLKYTGTIYDQISRIIRIITIIIIGRKIIYKIFTNKKLKEKTSRF